VQSSTNLQTWSAVSFTIPANGTNDPVRANFTASDVRVLQVVPQLPAGAATSGNYFFRLLAQ
jgi:hypothetical protein